jgi:hypothetical protein
MFGKKKKDAEIDAIQETVEPPKAKKKGNMMKRATHVAKRLTIGSIITAIGVSALVFGGKFAAGESVTSVEATTVSAEHNNKLVYLSGKLAEETLKDPLFGIQAQGVKLLRSVEYYEMGDSGEDFSWETFTEQEPSAEKLITSLEINSPKITVGAFELSESLSSQIHPSAALEITDEQYNKLSENAKNAFKLHEGSLFFGANPESPRRGDIRVKFKVAKADAISVLARQSGSSLSVFNGKEGRVEILSIPNKTKEQMLATAPVKKELFNIWILRGVAAFIILIGIAVIVGRKHNEPYLEDEEDTLDNGDSLEEQELPQALTEEAEEQQEDFIEEEPQQAIQSTEVEELDDDIDPLDDSHDDFEGFDLDDGFEELSEGEKNSPPSPELDSPEAPENTSAAPQIELGEDLPPAPEAVEHDPSPEGAAIDNVEEITSDPFAAEVPAAAEAPTAEPAVTPTEEIAVAPPENLIPETDIASAALPPENLDSGEFPANVEIIEPGSLDDIVVEKDTEAQAIPEEVTPEAATEQQQEAQPSASEFEMEAPAPTPEPEFEAAPEAATTEAPQPVEPSVPEFEMEAPAPTPEPEFEAAPEAATIEAPQPAEPSVPEFEMETPVPTPEPEFETAPEAAITEAPQPVEPSVPEFEMAAPTPTPEPEFETAPEAATTEAHTDTPTVEEPILIQEEDTPIANADYSPDTAVELPQSTETTAEFSTLETGSAEPIGGDVNAPEVELGAITETSNEETITLDEEQTSEDSEPESGDIPIFEMPTEIPENSGPSLTEGLEAAQEEALSSTSIDDIAPETAVTPETVPTDIPGTEEAVSAQPEEFIPEAFEPQTESFPWEETEAEGGEEGEENPPVPQVKEF